MKEDKDVYLAILEMFAEYIKSERNFNADILHTSFNETFGGWSKEHNQELYKEIDRVWETA